ncbi:hypothetical protein Metfor_1435 [Methanoregula formicica SMSP]|uniref:Uncharacterized protein n=2 Tax=Methanoregula formicica TaxID=882104 RepID=L0HEL3_METFS|nr:hypothetical protein Metfor_1435 [Methanoregula formicica SMSP]
MIVFTTIMDPGARLAEAACSEYNREATVNAVSPTFVQLTVSGFASRSAGDDGITMKIPALLFRNADKILNQYWFARLMNPDFSPHISRVTFPDGYGETFTSQAKLPAITHTPARSGH